MKLYFLALATCVVVAVVLLMLLRTRRLKEKYAAVWLLLAVAVCIIGAFPETVSSIASLVGVATASNLLFASALAVLFGVCIQLSVELSSTEEKARTLTEEVALLRLDLDRVAQHCTDARIDPVQREGQDQDMSLRSRAADEQIEGQHGD
jgi:hypothetical protein